MEKGLSGSNESEVGRVTPQNEFLDLICDTVEENCSLDTGISLDELPPEGGLYAELGQGFGDGPGYDKGASVRTMPVLFLCRHIEQKRCTEQLCSICNYLQTLKVYPQGTSVRWLNAVTAKEPSKIGRDEDGKYYGSCIINCLIYF